jgi:hypothetical protein
MGEHDQSFFHPALDPLRRLRNLLRNIQNFDRARDILRAQELHDYVAERLPVAVVRVAQELLHRGCALKAFPARDDGSHCLVLTGRFNHRSFLHLDPTNPIFSYNRAATH